MHRRNAQVKLTATCEVGEFPIEDSGNSRSIVRRLAAEVAVEGPLRIDEVGYLHFEVTFSGLEWSLAMLCTWRLLLNGKVIVDPDNMTEPFEVHTQIVTDAIWDLIGHEIV